MKRKLIWLILALAFLLRFVAVGNFPSGFNADEASFGYDAYSILNTGRDQWGNQLPILLKSFGDFKSPVYSYLTVPSVAIFGLNIFSTRLPNVIIGTLAVLVVYLLVLEICKYAKWLDYNMAGWLATIAAGLLAVNPWSVMMSRGAIEANLISFFLPLGIYFFIKGVKENKYHIWSVISMGIGMFTYHSAKVIIPLIFIGLVFIFRGELQKINIKKLIIPIIIFSIFFIGMLYTFKIGGGARVSERSITQGALLQGFDERMVAISKGQNTKIAKIFHNKYQVILKRFTTNYFQYFSPRFLIQKGVGDASYAMIPGISLLSIIEFIFLFGVFPLLIIDKKSNKIILLLLTWLAISPLPAALASGGGYSGNRASGMIPVLQIIETFGFYGWIILIKRLNTKYFKSFVLVTSMVFVFGIFSFINLYFKTQSTTILKQQGYGNLLSAEWLRDNANGRNVLISRSISEPQIFVAYANKWIPSDYQNATKTWGFDSSNIAWVDQLPEYSLGNYKFKSIDWKMDINSNALIAIRAEEFKGAHIPIKIFNYPDGTPNIYIIDTNQKIYAKAK